jgi:hypothetical protein
MDLQEVERGIDWIDQVQDNDRWQDLVDAVITLRVP